MDGAAVRSGCLRTDYMRSVRTTDLGPGSADPRFPSSSTADIKLGTPASPTIRGRAAIRWEEPVFTARLVPGLEWRLGPGGSVRPRSEV
jgi:hypothetical protein